ncbi:MAG: hypothetical protein RLY31_695 [Bacteroidota bacterium]
MFGCRPFLSRDGRLYAEIRIVLPANRTLHTIAVLVAVV